MQDLEFRQLVERIKLRSPIESVVGDRVSDLTKRGALHWARCPFHEERTPSFAVDPRKQTWRCYGACGEGGDVISFVQRFDGLEFLDALRLLARAAGEDVPETSLRQRSPAARRGLERRQDLLARAAKLFRRELSRPDGARALAYVEGRGFDAETLESFGIGWAPERGNPVLDAASQAGFQPDELVETGLCKRADDGRLFDFFRGRLMIPIRDRLGRTVGFGGRRLPGDTKALGKYVNTPETPLFRKGSLIYGLDSAADAVRKTRHLILVEGYTDVMAAHQAGVPNVAAVLGTATTEEHAGLVRRSGAERVSLLFDGDEAGRRATQRALFGFLPLGIRLDVVTPPAGSDPCDLLIGGADSELASGKQAFEGWLEGALEWFDWATRDLAELDGPALAAGVDDVFRLFLRLTKPVEQEARLVALSRRLGLSEEAIRRQWRAMGERERRASRPAVAPAQDEVPAPTAEESAQLWEGEAEASTAEPDAAKSRRETEPRAVEAFQNLLGALLLDNSLIPLYGELSERCPAGELDRIFRAILELYDRDDPEAAEAEIDASAVMTLLADDPARDRVVALEELARRADSAQALARDQELWLHRRDHERDLAALKSKLTESIGVAVGSTSPEETREPDDVLKTLHTELRKSRVPDSLPADRPS